MRDERGGGRVLARLVGAPQRRPGEEEDRRQEDERVRLADRRVEALKGPDVLAVHVDVHEGGDLPVTLEDPAAEAGEPRVLVSPDAPLDRTVPAQRPVTVRDLDPVLGHLTGEHLADARKALIGSGIVVIAQFALFLFIGLGLWAFYDARAFAKPDEIFPTFIVEKMPPGLLGLILLCRGGSRRVHALTVHGNQRNRGADHFRQIAGDDRGLAVGIRRVVALDLPKDKAVPISVAGVFIDGQAVREVEVVRRGEYYQAW